MRPAAQRAVGSAGLRRLVLTPNGHHNQFAELDAHN
jgi:hypothetical protein